MPRSCKCILDRMVFKGVMSEEERAKILRNINLTWTPTAERLPNKDGDYLTTKINDFGEKILGMTYFRNQWGWSTSYPIVAWIPLPEPYEEGEEE